MKKVYIERIPFVLAAITVVVMAASTFIEASAGTPFVSRYVYGTWWFTLLWAALAVTSVWTIMRSWSWKKAITTGLHLSMLIILAGALLTSLTSEKGTLHLRKGEGVSMYKNNEGKMVQMPFTLRLTSFKVICYAGTQAPQDYESRFVCTDRKGGEESECVVSMNNIFHEKGYRLYQSSFDSDMEGSWLLVNHDPYGTPIVYLGYALFALFSVLMMVRRSGRLKALLASPALKWTAVAALLVVNALPVAAENGDGGGVTVVERQQADSFVEKQVLYNDRVVPMNTVAIDFVEKITGRRSFRSLSAEQVLLSWMLYPGEWQYVPMIRIKSARLREQLGVEGACARFADFFESDGTYKLNALLSQRNSQPSALNKAVDAADESVGIILMLTKGQLFKPAPADIRRTDMQIKAEVLYNRLDMTSILFKVNLTLGLFLFLVFMARLLYGPDGIRRQWLRKGMQRAWSYAPAVLAIDTLALAFYYCLRWYVSGTIPLANGYETMIFVALALLIVGCVLCRSLPFIVPFAFLLSGFTLLVSHLGQMNPQITPLMPVLHSPWLSAHVSVIMVSYSLYAFMMLGGLVALLLMARGGHGGQVKTLAVVSRIMLYPATLLLGIGIFLGSIWANVSWGSYWSWDPKEVWALITMMVYCLPFHTHFMRSLADDRRFHVFTVAAFLLVLMTYFGVNYFLSGMHSYS